MLSAAASTCIGWLGEGSHWRSVERWRSAVATALRESSIPASVDTSDLSEVNACSSQSCCNCACRSFERNSAVSPSARNTGFQNVCDIVVAFSKTKSGKCVFLFFGNARSLFFAKPRGCRVGAPRFDCFRPLSFWRLLGIGCKIFRLAIVSCGVAIRFFWNNIRHAHVARGSSGRARGSNTAPRAIRVGPKA